MNRILLAALCIVAGVVGAECQSAPVTLYAESFRQGPAHIIERSFEAALTPQNPLFKARIKDAHGSERYVLSIFPRGPEGDNNITSWQVRLQDLHHRIYDNVLMSTQQPSSDPNSNLGNLDPSRFSAVPIGARRIVKVDSFYVLMEVKQYHFTPVDSPYLDSMTVDLKVTNSDPREATATQ